jgi:TonB family protein
MTAAMHHLFERRPLAGAMGIGLVAHVGLLVLLGLVLRSDPVVLEEDAVEVVPIDEEAVRGVAAQIEHAAATSQIQHAEPLPQAPRVPTKDREPTKEARPPTDRAHRSVVTQPGGTRGAGDAAESPTHASALLPPGMGERAPATREPPRELPKAQPRESGKAAPPPRPVAVSEAIEAAPAEIAPVANQAVVRARLVALTLFRHQVEGVIARHWFPSEVYARVDPSGQISGVERRTALKVRVRADGGLERVDIESSSGVPALDEEARAAFQRAQPFPRPPTTVVDSQGGFTFPFAMTLDLEMARWRSDVKRMVAALWHPRPRLYIDQDRVTVVKLLLGPDGAVAHAAIDTTSGSGFLDGSALSAVSPGLRLPRPPRSLEEVAGMRPVRIAFMHRFRGEHDLQVLADAADE